MSRPGATGSPTRDHDELAEAVAAVRRNGIAVEAVRRDNFPLTGACGGDGRCPPRAAGRPRHGHDAELPDRPFRPRGAAIAYLGMGSYMGETMSQNRQGHILGHVKDLGGDYADPNTRGYMTRAEMLFHADACDYVGLLCLHGAKSGGESRVASSVTVYNRILERRPDLAKVLCEDFYRSHTGEVNPGAASRSSRSRSSRSSTAISAPPARAPPSTRRRSCRACRRTRRRRLEAVELYRTTVSTNARSTSASSRATSSSSTISSRCTRGANTRTGRKTSRKRHLLRLWLSDPDGRPIPQGSARRPLRPRRASRGRQAHRAARRQRRGVALEQKENAGPVCRRGRFFTLRY